MIGLVKINYPTILVGCAMMVMVLEEAFIYGAISRKEGVIIIYNG